jgi:excisionase family DNA binding protein
MKHQTTAARVEGRRAPKEPALRASQRQISPKLLSVAQVAMALGIGITKAYELVWASEIASLRVGRVLRVRVEDVDAYIERQAAAGARGAVG